MMQIEKDKLAEKNKDQLWCAEKINLRKLRWPITSVALKVERATKKKSAKVLITIERSNHHSVTHLADRLEIYGYYEWLEIKEALKMSGQPTEEMLKTYSTSLSTESLNTPNCQ